MSWESTIFLVVSLGLFAGIGYAWLAWLGRRVDQQPRSEGGGHAG